MFKLLKIDILLLLLLDASFVLAADLKISPTTPIVEINKTLTLSVSGTVGTVKWIVGAGKIQGEGTQVTYLAPDQAGLDAVTVLDSEGNTGVVKIVITPPNNFLRENAQWKIFTNRSSIQALLLSEDGKTLWVGTNGGLEKRDAQTGELQQVLTSLDGLPGNNISFLLNDGQNGLWIGIWVLVGDSGGGLAHWSSRGKWTVYNEENLRLPGFSVSSLLSDGQNGLWIGSTANELAHLSSSGDWIDTVGENSGLLSNQVYCLLDDGQNGLWIGTRGDGLAHFSNRGEWTIYNQENSELPSDAIYSLLNGDQNDLWIGTRWGLAHLSGSGKWTVYNPKNSGLPGYRVSSLLHNDQGGLWIGTYQGGLVHFSDRGEWTIYTPKNSGLPDQQISSLLSEGQNGLWIGTYGGLAHRSSSGGWIDTPGGNLSNISSVKSLVSDGQNGLWIGTYYGLTHQNSNGVRTVYNKKNSGLPDDDIESLHGDGQNGLWIGMETGGLAHLTFGRQTELCTQTQINAATCQAIQQGQHAAIVVAAGGAQQTNTLWESTEAITARIYRTFYRRGMAKSEIYYLSPKTWADFDGDGFNDRINRITEDRNLTLDDLNTAFTWAKGRGKLDQPLYFFFMDHGGEGQLQLSPGVNLPAEELKALLDNYQNATGSQVIVVIETCHSGSLIPILSAPNRAVITSAKANEKAYFFMTCTRLW